MNRWVGLLVVAALLALAWVGYSQPQLFPADLDMPRLVFLLMALLLVSGAGYGFWRFRYDSGRALAGILFWGAALIGLAFAYAWLNPGG